MSVAICILSTLQYNNIHLVNKVFKNTRHTNKVFKNTGYCETKWAEARMREGNENRWRNGFKINLYSTSQPSCTVQSLWPVCQVLLMLLSIYTQLVGIGNGEQIGPYQPDVRRVHVNNRGSVRCKGSKKSQLLMLPPKNLAGVWSKESTRLAHTRQRVAISRKQSRSTSRLGACRSFGPAW